MLAGDAIARLDAAARLILRDRELPAAAAQRPSGRASTALTGCRGSFSRLRWSPPRV